MSKLCTPLVIYIVLSALSTISAVSSGHPIGQTLGMVLGMILMGALLYFLCQSGHTTAAWFLLLIPIVLMIVVMVAATAIVIHAE